MEIPTFNQWMRNTEKILGRRSSTLQKLDKAIFRHNDERLAKRIGRISPREV